MRPKTKKVQEIWKIKDEQEKVSYKSLRLTVVEYENMVNFLAQQ